eukprot:11783-Heterococcus_DN1.PRE.1
MRAAAQGQTRSAHRWKEVVMIIAHNIWPVRQHSKLSKVHNHATRQINAQKQVADHAALNSLPVVSAEEQDTLSACSTFSLMRSGAAGEADDSIAEDYMTS